MCDTEVKKRLDRIEKCVDENHRALRGSNGKKGLVTDVAKLYIMLESVKNLLTKDMKHIKESIDQRDKYEHEKLLSWPYLRDKAFMPISISIFTAIITAFLILRFGL